MINFPVMTLLQDKRFCSLLAADFFGAFNDNAFKMLVCFVLLEHAGTSAQGSFLLSLASIVFVLPFILFSTYTGLISDRFSKKHVMLVSKMMEVMIMAIACVMLMSGNSLALIALLFLMGIHSAIYAPAKYGIIPEVVNHHELSSANGFVQMATYAAIILGQASGGFLTANPVAAKNSGYVFMMIAVLGLLSVLGVKKVEGARLASTIEINPIKQMVINWRLICKDRGIFLSMLGLAYFSFLGACFQLNIMLYAKTHLSLDSFGASLLMVTLALGIGLGGVSAGRVSDQKIELGIVPLGAFGLAFMSVALGIYATQLSLVIAFLFCLGFFAGFYTVPLNAFIQFYSNPACRGQMLAANNFFSFSAILFGSLFFYFLSAVLHLTPAMIFIVSGVLTIIGAIYALKILPYALLRLVIWTLAHTFYRIRIINPEYIPAQGGALLVANHISFIDAVFITVATERPVRFIMNRDMYEWRPIHWLCRLAKVIPIHKSESPKEILRSLETAREALRNGELVCIFPEGQLTRTGNTLKFNKGMEFILKGVDVPIIPIHLDRIWGSIFSFVDGKVLARWPKVIPYPVTISVAPAMPASSAAFEVRQQIMALGAEAFNYRIADKMTLAEAFFMETRHRPFGQCMADSSGQQLNRLMCFSGSIALANRLRGLLKGQDKVGVLLPPSVAGSLANIALGILEKVPVNINYTASTEALASIIDQCQMKTCITSKVFLSKTGIQTACTYIYIEDLIAQLQWFDYAKAILSVMLPVRLLAHRIIFGSWNSRNNQSTATIMFTSGSTGIPKGVVLTHANVMSNLEGLYQLLSIKSHDCMLGVLPFFHSFGFTGTLWFPLIGGMRAVYHYNPLDAKTVGQLVEKHQATLLMATPTFLNTYMRRCEPKEFKSLRLVVVGAEKLRESLAQAFYEKYGILPMEGYGCTELSPIACVNLPDYNVKGIHQFASKMGTIGLPLPGIAVRITDIDSVAPLPCGQQGLLWVKGKNVMKEYLNQPAKTEEVIVEGWYKTGDIAMMDEDGFISITDRLSRFSKIAGEMVPHIKVEEAIQQAMGETQQVCAVTAIADEKKGERLAVIYTKACNIEEVIICLKESGLPNLWIPGKEMFIKVDSLPLLGTGKLDLGTVKKIANEKIFI